MTPEDLELAKLDLQLAISRERTRGKLAFILIGLLFVIFVGALVMLALSGCTGECSESVSKLTTALISPVSALVGTIVGFYFGSNLSKNSGHDRGTPGPGAAVPAVSPAPEAPAKDAKVAAGPPSESKTVLIGPESSKQ